MIQRIQTVYLILAFALCIACLCMPVAHFVTLEEVEKVDMYNLWLTFEDGHHLLYFCPIMMALLVIAASGIAIDIMLYKVRAAQMRLASFCMILLVLWYVSYVILCINLFTEMDAAWHPHWTASFPLVALILVYLAFRGILKDEMLVRSLDRLR